MDKKNYIEKAIGRIVNTEKINCSKIFIWGLSEQSFIIKDCLNSIGLDIEGYIDSDEEKLTLYNQDISEYLCEEVRNFYYKWNKKVFSPEIINENDDEVTILILSKYFEEMTDYIKKHNSSNKVSFYSVGSFDDYITMNDDYMTNSEKTLMQRNFIIEMQSK